MRRTSAGSAASDRISDEIFVAYAHTDVDSTIPTGARAPGERGARRPCLGVLGRARQLTVRDDCIALPLVRRVQPGINRPRTEFQPSSTPRPWKPVVCDEAKRSVQVRCPRGVHH
jgi:hypothetical protein